jgi:hypothetical protein
MAGQDIAKNGGMQLFRFSVGQVSTCPLLGLIVATKTKI